MHFKALSRPDGRGEVWLGGGAVAAAALIWSTSYAVTKVLLERIPPITIGALRFALASALLAVLVRRQRGWRPPPWRHRAAMGLAGLLGITAYFTLENAGVDLATASDAALIVAAYPVISFVVEYALGRSVPSAARLAGMALAVAGVALVVSGGTGGSSNHRLLGDLLLTLAGLVWAVYNIVAGRTGAGVSALTATYYQILFGTAAFAALSPIEIARWHAPTAKDALLVVYLAVVCSIAGFFAYMLGLGRVSGTTAVTVLNLIPVFGVVSAVVIAGESVRAVQLAGGAAIVAGVCLSLRHDVVRSTAPESVAAGH